jgi:PncC family amidohydrolase
MALLHMGNDAKEKMLEVQHRTIEEYGAVSEESAKEMALGALNSSKADIALAVTGIAGPGGGTEAKPVGLVYIALATKDQVQVVKNNFTGDRNAVRLAATKKALEMSIDAVENQ